MFLVDTPPGGTEPARKGLLEHMERVGMTAVPATSRLLEFYSVEATYLAMFLALGGLGLVLGTLGMGIVVLRNVLERRRELALLRCVGFSARQVTRVIVAEHWALRPPDF